MNMKYIIVTSLSNGKAIALNFQHIIGFQEEDVGTTIYLRDSKSVLVDENIFQILTSVSDISRRH